MKIYLDIVFFINFSFDFLLLLTVSIVLKLHAKISRILIGSLIGGLSIFLLFVEINSILLFLFKVFISIIMILIVFKKKRFIRNISYFYFISIILSGFIYFLNGLFSYKVEGIVFINNGFSINLFLLLILSPVILYFYIKQNKYLKNNVSNYHKVSIEYRNKLYEYDGYLDTGNKLREPYKNKEVSLLYDNKFKVDKYILVPYETVSNSGIIKCVKVDKMIIDNKYIILDAMIGIVDNKFKIDNCNLILSSFYYDIFFD